MARRMFVAKRRFVTKSGEVLDGKVLGEEDAHSLGRCQVGRPTKIMFILIDAANAAEDPSSERQAVAGRDNGPAPRLETVKRFLCVCVCVF